MATLSWVGVPSTLVLADGSAFTVDIQQGAGVFFGDITTTATVTVSSIAAVPLPAAFPLMVVALGGLALVGRRRHPAA